MPTPTQPESGSLLDEVFGGSVAPPAAPTQAGLAPNLLDELIAPAPGSAPVAPKSNAAQKSESNTLWGDAKAETALGELGAGLQSGARQVLSTPYALIGLGAHYYDEGLGAAYVEWSKQIAEGGAKRGIANLEDLTASPMTWARYVAGVTGEAVPFILSIMSGAGAGSLLARVLGRAAVPAATRQAIVSTAPAFGGAFATGAGIETGATAQELFGATGEVHPLTSIAAGSAKGALESLFPMVLARQYGLTIGQGTDLYSRILGTVANQGGGRLGQAAAGIGIEGVTELLQEEIDMTARNFFDEKFDQMSPEAWSRRMNAMVAGGIGGGIFSSLTKERAQTVLADAAIRDSVGETPIVFGADVNELPTMGPEQILKTAGNGLDATAGVATGQQLDQILGEVDLRSRGLYGAVVPGREVIFGTQDQANNDHDYFQGQGFMRLDPSRITRGDVTASVEDLPSNLTDPRVDFLNPNTISEASSKLAQAIALKDKASIASSKRTTERYLDAAFALYREAINLGARIEPFSDGQIVLRDQQKAVKLAQAQATVDPQVSRASLLETRQRAGKGGEFYVMAAGSPKARTRPGGKALDLENISPDDITSFPTRDLARQVLANHQVSRKLDLGAARARGIRFTPAAKNPAGLLQELVNVLQSMSHGVRFYKQKADTVERFMKLVDDGLRLDVAQDSEEFAVLRKVREGELVDKLRDEAGPEIVVDAATRRVVKQRAKRGRESRVSKTIGFDTPETEALFYSQMHNSSLQKLITGALGKAEGQQTIRTPYRQIAGSSPITNFLRELARKLGLKTDFFIEIVSPGSLGTDGVKYIEDTRALREGGKPQSRTIIQIDPWVYAIPTLGGKELKRNPSRTSQFYISQPLGEQKLGDSFNLAPATAPNLKKTGVSKEDFQKQHGDATHFVAIRKPDDSWNIIGTGNYDVAYNQLKGRIDAGSLVRVADPTDKSLLPWKTAKPQAPYVYTQLSDDSNFSGLTFYHGTNSNLTDISKADVFGFGDAEALFGIGLYLSDNPAIAKSYSVNKGKGENKKVLAGKLADIKVVDLEKVLPPDALQVFIEAMGVYSDSIDEQALQNMTGKAVFDSYRTTLSEEGLTKADALEDLQNLAIALGNLGYDGFVHQGGQRRQTNLGPHNVVILFENAGIKDGKRVGKGIEENIAPVEYTEPVDVAPPPPFQERKTKAGELADQLGTVGTKMYTEDMAVAQFYTDFTAALGQVIVRYEWDTLTASEQDLIQTAYNREQNASRSLTRRAALARTFAHPILERAIGERGRKKDLYSFEEWLVQHISRALIDGNSPLGPVREFFAKAGRKIVAMLNDTARLLRLPFSADRFKGGPSKEVMKWLEKMQQRGLQNQDEPFLSETTRKKAMQAVLDNQEALKSWNMDYVVATPQRASTVQVRKLLSLVPDMDADDKRNLKGLLASADRHNTVLEWMLGIHQLADLNPHIPSIRSYVSLTRALEDDAMSWASMADERIRQAQALPKPQQRSLWALMNDLDQMIYLDQKKLKSGVQKPRWPKADELIVLVRKHNLSKESFDVYRNIRTDYLSFLTQVEITGIRNAEETITDPVLVEAKIKEVSGDIARMRAQPYFPHMRFGKYIVTVKDNAGQVKFFAAFDTQNARDAAMAQITKEWKVPEVNSIVEDVMSPAMQQFQGLPRFALEAVKKALGLDAGELTTRQQKDRDVLEGLAFDSIPTNSFRHNLAERQNTPGYSMDGMRAYGTYFARSARFVARMGYAHRLQEAIKDVRRTASPISKDSRTRIADYMQRHFDQEMNPVAEYATVRAMGFMWYFAFAPAAAFVNLSQVPMVTYPYLASKFPGTKRGIAGNALQTLNANVKELTGWVKGKVRLEDGPKQEALDEAHASRIIDDGFAQELAAISQGSVLARTIADGAFARSIRMLSQWGTYPFAAAERFNRSVTFRTAYDLALANPDNVYVREALTKNKAEVDRLRIDRGWGDRHIASYIFAAQTVRDTQFEYSRWARPKIMTGMKGVFFMFKTYLQNMMFFMFNANRGTQVRFMLLLFATAGIMGMPGAEDAEAVAKAIGKLLGYRIDPQMWVRRMVKEYAGDGVAPDILLHGASRAGFGIPAALNGLGVPAGSADLSGSLSMGKLIPGLSVGLNHDSSNFRELLGDVTRDIAGPALGVPIAMYNSIVDHSLPSDDPKRWERAMPRALKDLSRSSRYLAEQRERDSRGATIVKFDPNDVTDQMDALAVGLGFQPTALTRQWDAIEAQREVQNYWKGQRKILMDGFARADRLKDVEGKQDARSAIGEFNKQVPDGKLKITQDSLQRSLKTRERERRAKETRTPTAKNLQGVSRDVQALFPEAPPPGGRRQLGPTQSPAVDGNSLLDDMFGPAAPFVPEGMQEVDRRRVR